MKERRARATLVGVGKMGQTIHLPTLASASEVELVTVVDPYAPQAQLEQLAKAWDCGWARQLPDSEIDLAVVATPVSSHIDIALSALDAGCHVLIEKPLGESADRVRELLERAEARGRRVFCGQVRRLYPNNVVARTAIVHGLLGSILRIRIYEGNLYGWARAFSSDPDDASYAIDNGVLFDVGSHSIDAVRYILGPLFAGFEVVDSVTDDEIVQSEIWSHLNIFSGSGRIPWEIALSNTTGLANCVWIEGETGALCLAPAPVESRLYLRDGSCLTIGNPSQFADPFATQLAEVVARIKDGKPSAIDAAEILGSVEVLESIIKETRAGLIPWRTNYYEAG